MEVRNIKEFTYEYYLKCKKYLKLTEEKTDVLQEESVNYYLKEEVHQKHDKAFRNILYNKKIVRNGTARFRHESVRNDVSDDNLFLNE